jgi:hypothetical protein
MPVFDAERIALALDIDPGDFAEVANREAGRLLKLAAREPRHAQSTLDRARRWLLIGELFGEVADRRMIESEREVSDGASEATKLPTIPVAHSGQTIDEHERRERWARGDVDWGWSPS